MGEAKRRSEWLAKELQTKFGGNPGDTAPHEAEAYIRTLCLATNTRQFPVGSVEELWRHLQGICRVRVATRL